MQETPIQHARAAPVWRLVVLSSLPGIKTREGHWLLPAKFVNGMKQYVEHWDGPVVVGLQAGDQPTGDLDNRHWHPGELPFEVRLVDFRELARLGGPLLQRSIVLATLNHLLYGLGKRCQEQGGILVANTELTLTTQLQIARSVHGWGRAFLKTGLWLLLNHRRALMEIRSAQGLQCNGTPTFDAFARHNPSPLLYFDNRVASELCATPEEIEARSRALSRGQRLRLMYSGRLHPIKGVHHLVSLARQLRDRNIDFELRIAGDGPLRTTLESQIATHRLHEQVRLLGTLDFRQQLLPMLRHEIDLFVCPHLQGDPSCTYLETLCAGVPIVGYANEAWRGLQQLSSAGRICALGRPEALACEIEALSSDHEALKALATRALKFSVQHVFDAEFERRIVHLRQLCNAAELRT
jgi:glycosyltransferase involved in cell wall biosynthesis